MINEQYKNFASIDKEKMKQLLNKSSKPTYRIHVDHSLMRGLIKPQHESIKVGDNNYIPIVRSKSKNRGRKKLLPLYFDIQKVKSAYEESKMSVIFATKPAFRNNPDINRSFNVGERKKNLTPSKERSDQLPAIAQKMSCPGRGYSLKRGSQPVTALDTIDMKRYYQPIKYKRNYPSVDPRKRRKWL